MCEKSKKSRVHSESYFRVVDAIDLHIFRKGYDIDWISKHVGGQNSRDLNSVSMTFMNGRHPVHMYFLLNGQGSTHKYFRADSLSSCIANIISAIEEIVNAENSILR